MKRALILGGTGLIGQATARRLLAAGWQVDVAGRNSDRMPVDIARAGGTFVRVERSEQCELAAALGAGADLLVDCICFSADHAKGLIPLMNSVGSTVMISSKAVYVDDAGNHSNSDDPPHFSSPIRESQSTLAPGTMDYNTREGYGPNKVAAERVLLDSGWPVTVIRPSKVHGVGAANPREWVFVRRVLDKRPAVFLARRGAGVDHTTASVNIAALIEMVASVPGQRVLNSADPDAPSALEISRIIAGHLHHDWEEILLEDEDGTGLGDHPWNVVYPIVLDTSAAAELGYVPVGDYAMTVAAEIDWLVAVARGDSDQRLPATDDPYSALLFNYSAEDAFLAARSARTTIR